MCANVRVRRAVATGVMPLEAARGFPYRLACFAVQREAGAQAEVALAQPCVEIDLFELVPRCLLERVIQRAEQQLTGEQLTPGFLDAPGARESLQNDLTPPPPPKGSWTLQSSMATPPLPDITVAFVAGEKFN